MKLIIFILLFFPVLCLAQNHSPQYFTEGELKNVADPLQYQISYTNYCLNNYRKEKLIGTWSQIGGGALFAFSSINSLNGVDAVSNTFELEIALAGENKFKQLVAERKYESGIKDIEDRNHVLNIIGGVVFFAGSIVHLHSYKWLKKSYILPAEHGIGVQIRF